MLKQVAPAGRFYHMVPDQVHVGPQRTYLRLRRLGPCSTPSGLGILLNCMLLILNPFGVRIIGVLRPINRRNRNRRKAPELPSISLRSLRILCGPRGLGFFNRRNLSAFNLAVHIGPGLFTCPTPKGSNINNTPTIPLIQPQRG